jgi:hypothetical protein
LITFAKVNSDEQQPLCSKYSVSTLPTILLFENGKETQRMTGSDVRGLAKITERFSQITESTGSSVGSSAVSGVPLPRGYSDVTSEIDIRGLDLMNANGKLGSVRTLFSDTKPSGKESASDSGKGKGKATEEHDLDWIESDTDSQLMLFVPFQSTVKLHSLQITSFANRDEDEEDDDVPARPRRIELYTNRPHTLGFEESEDIPATQIIELKPENWNHETKTAVVETRFVKFQNITSVVVFVVDAEGGAEKTRIDRIRVIGESGEKREMGKLQKIGEDEP